MEPIRLFILRNLTTALFMAAYYEQQNLRSINFRDICIILVPDASEIASEQKFIDAARKLATSISSEILVCPEPESTYPAFSLSNISGDRPQKMRALKIIQDIFRKNDINKDLIKEIYHGNRAFHQYIKYLNPKAGLIGFEHGASDIKGALLRNTFSNRLKDNIKCALGKLFFIFYPFAQNDDETVSLFAKEIKKANKKHKIKNIEPKYIVEVANNIAHDEFVERSALDSGNAVGVILTSDGYQLAGNKECGIKFHIDFAKYILKKIRSLAPQIDTIVFKPRSFDAYFSQAKPELLRLFTGYKVYFFDEITKTNFPIEYYIGMLKPKVVFGDISSGLFYSKALDPNIKTYSFHEYAISYQQKYFGTSFSDYKWLDGIFFTKYAGIFRDLLPDKIKVQDDDFNAKT